MTNHSDTSTLGANWFYLDGSESKGPLDAPSILRALMDRPNPTEVLVRRDGLGQWRKAGNTELGPLLPSAAQLPVPVHIEKTKPVKNSQSKETEKPRGMSTRSKITIAIIAAPFVVSGLIQLGMTPAERVEANRRRICEADSGFSDAKFEAKSAVTKNLRAPSTAEFPSVMGVFIADVQRDDDCIFSVTGKVDAQNAFGAMLRSYYKVRLSYDPKKDTWSALSVSVD